jgi:hypothetical protein
MTHLPSDESYERRLEDLRKEIKIGVEQADRGEVVPLDIEEIKAEGRRRLAEDRMRDGVSGS